MSSPVANPDRSVPFRPMAVAALEPLVVTSPDSSAAVRGEPPRTSPVSVLPVPVPPLLTGTVAKDAVVHAPAPPPSTKSPLGSAPLDVQVLAPLKHGIPPLVPATVKAGVLVGEATLTMPPVKLTEVTVPAPLANC